MKPLIFLYLVFVSILCHSQSKDDCRDVDSPESVRIYYSNGMRNDEDSIIENFDALIKLVGKQPNSHDFGISVNETEGFLLDFLQVFKQKSIENPEREYSSDKFWTWIRNLTIAPAWFKFEYRRYISRFTDAVVKSDPDLIIQVKDYIKDLKQGKKVLVVAHSQGNLYANNAYRYIQFHPIYSKYKKSIGIVSIGSVSNQVADQIPYNGRYNYYTLNAYDGVVNLLRIFYPVLPPTGSKATGGDGLNHSFKYSYIANDGFPFRIRNHIFKKINLLDQPEIDFECKDPNDVPIDVTTLPPTQVTDVSAVLNGKVESGKQISTFMVLQTGTSVVSCSSVSRDYNDFIWNTGNTFYSHQRTLISGIFYTYKVCGKRKDGTISEGKPITFLTVFT